jgi:hypothetical protein
MIGMPSFEVFAPIESWSPRKAAAGTLHLVLRALLGDHPPR